MTRTHTLPTGTMATPLGSMRTDNAPDLVQSSAPAIIYKDPHDVLETHLEFHPEFHGRVASAMAFTIDKAVIRQAKTVLYSHWNDIKAVSDQTFNMYCLSLRDTFYHDSLYEVDGPLRTMATMMAVREQWHDIAGKLIGLAYDPQSLKAQVRADNADAIAKAREVAPDIIEVHKINAQFWCDGDEEEMKQFLADILSHKQNTAKAWADADKLVEPSIIEIISIVGRHIDTSWSFTDMPERVQESLMKSCIGSLKKLVLKATERMRGQEIAQAKLNMVTRRCVKALEQSIISRFNDAGELENTASQQSIDLARAKKRAAWNEY